ncbi:HD-GYP domain-containing protein [Azotosporobacter soli]|uniref:HD-GYP domain-containing protein n=1 Tax=Azotosporobacter soli TaxID=3055040 RepID=UPI0031FF2836
MLYNIHPLKLFRALSLSLELSHDGSARHHWRTAMIASRIAEELPIEDSERQLVLHASLLHDIGAAAHWDEEFVGDGAFEGAAQHAEAGYRLLKDSRALGRLALPIRYHHARWDGMGAAEPAGKAIPLAARIIHAANRMETLLAEEKREHVLLQQRPILKTLASEAGKELDPAVVAVLLQIAEKESFWLDLINYQYYDRFFSLRMEGHMHLQLAEILDIAEIFATLIDQASQFTARHSRFVSQVAALLAEKKGFCQMEVTAMRIAGLLHDLGKLSIPAHVLEKEGKLAPEEQTIMRQHTYYTYRILSELDDFPLISQWAAYHHETLDGEGYPFRVPGEQLRLGSRIVAVADVFVALTEPRPYRPKLLTRHQVEEIMQERAAKNKLDDGLVKLLFQHYREACAGMHKWENGDAENEGKNGAMPS